MNESLTDNDKLTLLAIAREAIVLATQGKPKKKLNLRDYPSIMRENCASFVSLHLNNGQLRGCIGTLEAYQPMILDVQEHAVAAALEDYRFKPVNEQEVQNLKIEISLLSQPILLEYNNPEDLVTFLKPEHGVILMDGRRRATFLPQVWQQIPVVEDFLAHLCLKMGRPENYWRYNHLDVFTYTVDVFSEE